ncbi:MAG: helix-turn-helix domain-containing protein [Pseudomonadota bacterium]
MTILPDLNVRSSPYAVDAFRTDLQVVCGAFNVEPDRAGPETLQAHLSVATTGGLDLARVGLNADHVHRGERDIRRDPGEHFFLVLQQKGRAHLSQGDVSAWAEPGDMFLVDAARPSRFAYEGQYSLQLSVHLPREEMLHRFGKRIYGGINIAASDPLGLAMKAVLAKLISTPDAPAHVHTVEAFYSVFGALLTERALSKGHTPNADRQLVTRALATIAEHYRNPEFKTQSLADSLGVSLRRLQRSFQITGETPHDRLQRYRVTAAHDAIQGAPGHTITDLAYGAGFSDLSTFYRAYRKHFGHAPGQADAIRKRS